MSLKRILKFNRLVAVTMGTPLASSVFPSLILLDLTAYSLIDELIAVLFATILVIMVSLAYSQLVSIYPTAAGNRVFLKKPLGDVLALGLSLMWTFIILGAAGVEGYVVGYLINYLISLYYQGPLLQIFSPFILSLIVMTIILTINILGVELSGNFQMIITYFIAASLAIVSILSLIFLKNSTLSYNNGFGNFDIVAALSAAAIGVYFFLGFGRVTTLGEEAIDYKRSLPLAIPTGVSILGTIFILLSTALLLRVPISTLITFLIPQVFLGKYLIGGGGAVFMIIVSILMTFSTFNAGVLGTSRLIYALGREGTLPKLFGRVHSRYFTPYIGILLLYFVAVAMLILVTITQSFSIPLYVAAGFDSFMYAAIGYSALWHARKMKDYEYFRVKGSKLIFTLVTIIFTLLGILLLLTTPIIVSIIIIIGTILLILYAWLIIRRLKK
jgi:Gamma-aminobutyrate permease and related permeases